MAVQRRHSRNRQRNCRMRGCWIDPARCPCQLTPGAFAGRWAAHQGRPKALSGASWRQIHRPLGFVPARELCRWPDARMMSSTRGRLSSWVFDGIHQQGGCRRGALQRQNHRQRHLPSRNRRPVLCPRWRRRPRSRASSITWNAGAQAKPVAGAGCFPAAGAPASRSQGARWPRTAWPLSG